MIRIIKFERNWKPYVVLAILTFALYGNTLNHFFAIDDSMVITKNKYTQQGIKGIPAILKYNTFTGVYAELYEGLSIDADPVNENSIVLAGGRYRPLSLVTFALEIEFFGKENTYISGVQFRGNAFVSHLVNIFLYLFTVCLLFLILNHIFPSDNNKKWYFSFPFITVLLFLFHPIHTEVVANIKGRDEIMALLGSLSALWFAIKYCETNKYYYLVLSGLCLFLGLLSKENAITFVGVIPVTLYYFRGEKIKKILISIVPLIIVSVLFLLIHVKTAGSTNTEEVRDLLNNPFVNANTSETFATSFYTLLLYIKLLFFPHPLTWDYYPFHIEIVNWLNPIVVCSFLIYLGIGLYGIYGFFKKRDIISWSIWLYLMPLSVVSNLFFPIGAFMGERFLFFSSIGFAVFIGWLIYIYTPKLIKNIQYAGYFTGSIFVIILCLYSFKTISRNKVWKDNFTIFTTDIKTSKKSAKGNYEAGNEYIHKALSPDDTNNVPFYCYMADLHLKTALLLHPQYFDAMMRIGDLHAMFSGDIAQSLKYYAMALNHETLYSRRVDNVTREILNLTNILLDNKQVISTPEEILKSCDLLLSIRPDIGEALFVKGVIYGKYLNNLELALLYLERALAMNFTKTVRFYEYMGTAYGMSGNYPDALLYLLKAVEMGTDDIDTYLNLGIIYQQLGELDNAHYYTSKGQELSN